MQAQKGEDELAAPALIPRIKRAGLASATPQVRGAGRRLASGFCPQRWGRTGGQQDYRGFD